MNILQSYKIAASALLLFTGSAAIAQPNTDPQQPTGANESSVNTNWQPSLVTDGVYDRVPHVNTALGWQNIREADILWKKRVWREIDTRQKQNMAFRFPGDENTGGGYFIEILIDAVKKGKIKAYSNLDDRFTTALTREQVMDMLTGKIDTVYAEDPTTGQMIMKISRRDFDPNAITKYRIKEDVIFDRNLGRMVTRIIGLAPYKDIMNEDGSYRASQGLFWLYYPEIRELLAQYEVFNPENDVARMNWDEYFEGRFFSSRIVKVSNPFDAGFREMGMSNMEALYESEAAGEDLFNKEHDMWVY